MKPAIFFYFVFHVFLALFIVLIQICQKNKNQKHFDFERLNICLRKELVAIQLLYQSKKSLN